MLVSARFFMLRLFCCHIIALDVNDYALNIGFINPGLLQLRNHQQRETLPHPILQARQEARRQGT